MSDIYLIIGASSDVGVELIRLMSSSMEDIKIIAHYNRSADSFNKIDIKGVNELIPVQCNLSNDDNLKMFINKVKQIGVPKGIVHLPAPKLDYIRFKDLEWQDCAKDFDIQVKSAFTILKELLPSMIKTPEMSKVVFMLSENTINVPAKFTAKYTMSKYMLMGLMKSLSSEYSGKRVNINALSPTMINTKFLSNIDRRLL